MSSSHQVSVFHLGSPALDDTSGYFKVRYLDRISEELDRPTSSRNRPVDAGCGMDCDSQRNALLNQDDSNYPTNAQQIQCLNSKDNYCSNLLQCSIPGTIENSLLCSLNSTVNAPFLQSSFENTLDHNTSGNSSFQINFHQNEDMVSCPPSASSASRSRCKGGHDPQKNDQCSHCLTEKTVHHQSLDSKKENLRSRVSSLKDEVHSQFEGAVDKIVLLEKVIVKDKEEIVKIGKLLKNEQELCREMQLQLHKLAIKKLGEADVESQPNHRNQRGRMEQRKPSKSRLQQSNKFQNIYTSTRTKNSGLHNNSISPTPSDDDPILSKVKENLLEDEGLKNEKEADLSKIDSLRHQRLFQENKKTPNKVRHSRGNRLEKQDISLKKSL